MPATRIALTTDFEAALGWEVSLAELRRGELGFFEVPSSRTAFFDPSSQNREVDETKHKRNPEQTLKMPVMGGLSSAPQPRSFRSSQRLTITLPQAVLEALTQRSDLEGRSLSNLAAYLLESELERHRR